MYSSLMNFYKKINANIWTEWIFRLFFTFEFFHTGTVIQEEHYPDTCWLLILISIWLYFFKYRIAALVPLFLSAFIHYVHVSSSEI